MVKSVCGYIIFYETDKIFSIKLADSTVSCFADDTRILLGIKDEEDTQCVTQMIQNGINFKCDKIISLVL